MQQLTKPKFKKLRVFVVALSGHEIPGSVYDWIKADNPGYKIQVTTFNRSFNVDFRLLEHEGHRLRNELLNLTAQRDGERINCFSPCDKCYYIPPSLSSLAILGYVSLTAVHGAPVMVAVRRERQSQTFQLSGAINCQTLYETMRGISRPVMAETITL